MYIKGTARVDRRTKDLVKRLMPGEIAIINHSDLDNLAAQSLVAARPKAVINAASSITGYYPNPGPLLLVQSGLSLLDAAGENVMGVEEGQVIEIIDNDIYADGKYIGNSKSLEIEDIREKMAQANLNMNKVFSNFVENTIEHAKNELGMVAGEYNIPTISTVLKGKHVLVVVRGQNYKEDLEAVRSYIREVKPVLIGVDGGADALWEFGYKPDIIIGDMDSVSNDTLFSGAELIVHAYPNGRAPGLERIKNLGLPARTFAIPGTSEDIAMLLAYEQRAELIVAVGTHSSVEEFLEKGRHGMASTLLVRMKIGSILVDAKGVSKLYRGRIKARYLAQIVLAALLPLGVIVFVSPVTRELLRLVYLQFKLFLGI
ncbi:MAG TPA: hypothetical protein DCK76_07885 [Desulfotomaculum sp.]|nr:MAG: Thiamin pyrophosphokinase catalytic domain-containing protein [Desulfotomaculum sp. 46_80]HAG11288.1 hypothetical protein [Desulfotomaculum sp.]HBY03564.1 hypothetical protein [Desulfotomaculum sp.]